MASKSAAARARNVCGMAGPFRSLCARARPLAWAGALCAAFAWPGMRAEAADAGCEAAGTLAEQRYEVPAGLLLAIGRVESGRRDPGTGRLAAWPWTINAQGRGQLFETREAAQVAVQALQKSGVASIDVGCFQVNLAYHPDAFPHLEDGFDPAANADYAARFLLSLKAKLGSWPAAVAAYHSATPELGGPYRDRVLAGWPGGGELPQAALPAPVAAAPVVFAMRVETWSAPRGAAAGGIRVWTPSAVGQGPTLIRIVR